MRTAFITGTKLFIKMKQFASILTILLCFLSCNNSDQKKETPATASQDNAPAVATKKNIVFFGNSLTAGYGLDPQEAFPALIQKKIDSLNLSYTVVNAGVSGETSSGGNGRVDWILRQGVAVFVLELGANDGLRGIPIAETKRNLQAIIDKVKTKFPSAKIVLAGMQIPPNMGQAYGDAFKNIYPQLAKENNASLVPFLLEGVGGETTLNQEDGIHPTAEGHLVLANNTWKILASLL